MSSQSVIYVFLGYGEGKKEYHYFDPITQKLYVSRHVVFLEHIHFFSILSTTHSLTRFDLIRIDPFLNILIIYHLEFLVLQILILTFLPPLPLHSTQPIRTDHSAGIATLLSDTHTHAPFSSMVPQALSEIVNPPLRQSICIRKSIKLLDFFYSCYSSSFTFFLAFIHCLSEPSSYKKKILDLLWQ